MKIISVRYFMFPRSMILWSKLVDMLIQRIAGREVHELFYSRPIHYSGLNILFKRLMPALSLFYFRQAFKDELQSKEAVGGALLIMAEKT